MLLAENGFTPAITGGVPIATGCEISADRRHSCSSIAPHQPAAPYEKSTVTASNSRLHPGIAITTKRGGLLDRYFYFFMSLLIPAVVIYGFSFTVDKNLIHPAIPRPPILYVHAAVFSGWLVFFLLQSALVRTHNVGLHRRIGWFGAGLGVLILVLGVSTAIAMGRFNTLQMHATDAESFLMVPLFDMVCFSSTFALAIYWRKKPEFHRRLMLIATCALTAASFGRFPERLLPHEFFYAGVDLLILLGVIRDMIVGRGVHRIYFYVLPAFIVGQTIVIYTVIHNLSYWSKIAHAIL
jgi:hypothetical protein